MSGLHFLVLESLSSRKLQLAGKPGPLGSTTFFSPGMFIQFEIGSQPEAKDKQKSSTRSKIPRILWLLMEAENHSPF